LFPGEADVEPGYESYREPGVSYELDSVNPLTWHSTLRRIVAAPSRVVVMPWWTVYFAPCFRYLAGALRRRGRRVIFMCHNVVDHEASPLKKATAREVLRMADAFCVHNPSEAAELGALFDAPRVAVHPHPVYVHHPAAKGTLQRRAPLELLFFGLIRRYKGLDVLLRAVARMRRRDVHLRIVGEFWEERAESERRIVELGLADRVELVPRFVSQEEAAEYFAACDAVVLPYRNATGSGVVAHAYGYGKPVISSRVGGLPQVVIDGETGRLVPPEDPEALAQVLDGLTPELLRDFGEHVVAARARLTWDGLARTLLELAADLEGEQSSTRARRNGLRAVPLGGNGSAPARPRGPIITQDQGLGSGAPPRS
jgi:glycosyltransferase involved in cell wall biosynthesis